MSEVRSTAARRKANAGLVSVRVGAVKVGEEPGSFWVPVATAEKIRRMAERENRTEPKQETATPSAISPDEPKNSLPE